MSARSNQIDLFIFYLKFTIIYLDATSTIQAVLRDAEEKKVKNKALKNWLAKLKDEAYDIEDISEEFNYEVLRQEEVRDHMKRKVRDFFSVRNPVIFRIRMINRIKEIVERLDNIASEKSKFHLTESGPVDRQHLITGRPETLFCQRVKHLWKS